MKKESDQPSLDETNQCQERLCFIQYSIFDTLQDQLTLAIFVNIHQVLFVQQVKGCGARLTGYITNNLISGRVNNCNLHCCQRNVLPFTGFF